MIQQIFSRTSLAYVYPYAELILVKNRVVNVFDKQKKTLTLNRVVNMFEFHDSVNGCFFVEQTFIIR